MMINNIIEQSVKQILLPRVSCISCNNSLDYLDELYTIIKEHYENMWKSLQHSSFALSEWNQFKNNIHNQFSIYLTPILSTVHFPFHQSLVFPFTFYQCLYYSFTRVIYLININYYRYHPLIISFYALTYSFTTSFLSDCLFICIFNITILNRYNQVPSFHLFLLLRIG